MSTWRTFQELTAAETTFLAQRRLSSDTLEVTCVAGQTSFSVVNKTNTGYEWAHLSAIGEYREHGIEPSREQARKAALEVQRLWAHRCAAAGTPPCPGICFAARPAVS